MQCWLQMWHMDWMKPRTKTLALSSPLRLKEKKPTPWGEPSRHLQGWKGKLKTLLGSGSRSPGAWPLPLFRVPAKLQSWMDHDLRGWGSSTAPLHSILSLGREPGAVLLINKGLVPVGNHAMAWPPSARFVCLLFYLDSKAPQRMGPPGQKGPWTRVWLSFQGSSGVSPRGGFESILNVIGKCLVLLPFKGRGHWG